MTDLRVLVVEDDPDGQEVLDRILRHHGMEVDMVNDANDALNMLGSSDYTLAIIDLALPGMDGWQLLGTIQNEERFAHMPCIAVTAYHSAEVANQAIRAGFSAYFQKPVERTSFIETLEQILSS